MRKIFSTNHEIFKSELFYNYSIPQLYMIFSIATRLGDPDWLGHLGHRSKYQIHLYI